jgi:RimJ/RimL family protein N-acetyltransferase
MNLNPLEVAALQGDYVRLEPLCAEHVEALCEVGLDPELWRLSPRTIRTRDDMRGYVASALEGQRQGDMLPFATVHIQSGRVVGSTRFCAVNREHRRVEVGSTWIARPWQRTAVNTEAKLLMLAHAFEVFGCNRIEFKTDRLNRRSRDAILRLGAREEGILRKHMVTAGGRIRDSVYFSILDSEWPAVKADLKGKLLRHGAAP